MEQVKKFLNSPKKTAILGLIGSVIIIFFNLQFSPQALLYRIINNIEYIGLIVYFIIILTRIYKKSGNIKIANSILIIGFIINLLLIIKDLIMVANNRVVGASGFPLYIILSLILSIIYILFFINILFKKSNFINNKVFVIALIIYVVYNITQMSSFSLVGICWNICELSIIPYFYNYYELLKGEKENG